MAQTSTLARLDELPSEPTATVIRFFRAIDDREYAILAPLLAPDGVWLRQGKELRNEAEILAAMAQRSPTMRVHHLLTNMYTEACGDGEVEVCAYMLVVLHDSKSESTGPSPLSGIDSIRTMRARLRQTELGWRIDRLANDPPSFVA